jgi:hypothetical protein
MGAAESADFQLNTNIYSDIKIELDKQKQWYVPGETVSGTLFIGQQYLQKGSVSIDLIGELGYTMNYSTDTNSVRTAYHRFAFFTVSKSSITNEEKFNFRLDDNLPPSVNVDKDTYPYIRYAVQVNLSRVNKHRHWIIVCPRVIIPQTNIHPVYFDAFNRKQMRLTGSISVEWILPGERFQLEYKIYNQNQELIKHMDGNISMRAKIRGIEYNEKVMDFVIDDIQETRDDQITGMIPLMFPLRYFPPTFKYKDAKNTLNVHVEYWVTIEVHVHGMNTSLRAAVPLMIGFEPENITFDNLMSPDQHRFSTISMHTKRHSRKHRFHRFSHS